MDTRLKLTTWRAAPFLADLLGLLLFWVLLPNLTARFHTKSMLNALIIGGVYLLFCAAVVFTRKLEGEDEGAYIKPGGLLVFLAVMFGIFITYMMADAAGLFANLDTFNPDFDNVAVSVGILLGLAAWFGLVFLYPGILMVEIRPSISRSSGQYFWIELLALLGINLMVIVTVAHWEATFSDTIPYEGLGMGAKLLIFTFTFAFFLLFYAPPRFLLASRNKQLASMSSFLLGLAYYVWTFLSRVAWI